MNDLSSSSHTDRYVDQNQNNKLLTEIRSRIHLRHVIPNEHKQCTKMLYDKTFDKAIISNEDNVSKKETKLDEQKRIHAENLLINAMRKRRFVMRFESSSSDENETEQELEH
uniref:Uncharacterized protein n=1 Tax=Onchocerca volvulus TaxID=6282 RepID=A0A2K6VSK9_ONCVO